MGAKKREYSGAINGGTESGRIGVWTSQRVNKVTKERQKKKEEYVDRRNNRVGFTLYLAAFTQQNFTHLFTAV